MPNTSGRGRGRVWNNPGKSFVVIGDPGPPSAVQESRRTGADLVDPDDPAIRFIVRAATELSAFGYDPSDPDVAARAIAVGRERYEESPEVVADRLATLAGGPIPIIPAIPRSEVVYYMRIGNRVKIGWSTSLSKRLETINPEELMVVESGGRKLEQARHRQFRDLRTHGEWFRFEDPLTGHIEELRRAEKQAS